MRRRSPGKWGLGWSVVCCAYFWPWKFDAARKCVVLVLDLKLDATSTAVCFSPIYLWKYEAHEDTIVYLNLVASKVRYILQTFEISWAGLARDKWTHFFAFDRSTVNAPH